MIETESSNDKNRKRNNRKEKIMKETERVII